MNLSNAVTTAADNTMIINGFLNQVSTPATNTPTILGQSETSSPENNVDVAATENKITMAAAENNTLLFSERTTRLRSKAPDARIK